MIPAAEIRDPEVRASAEAARAYLEHFRWCDAITQLSLAFAVAGVVSVFRADIRPVGESVDPTVWVVMGDLPPAYLAFEQGDTWQDALAGYVTEMQEWVDAVRNGDPLDELIPVNVAPTREHADMLATRVAFLRDRLVEVDPESIESDV